MRTIVAVDVPEGTDPFMVHSTDSKRTRFRRFITMLKAVVSGSGVMQSRSSGGTRPAVWVGTAPASAIVTCAAVEAADTVTLNGTALTATQHNATGTVTAATAIADDTVTIDGVEFTAVAGAAVAGTATFSIDTGDNETAASLAAQINAYVPLQSIVTAKAAAAVVTIRAVTGGTAGNAITLESSDGATLAVSAATLENGATVASNQFDYVGTDTETATALCNAVAASATSLVSGQLVATNYAGTIALSSVAAGQTVSIGPVTFTAVSLTGNGIDEFAIGGTDTQDAVSLVTAINAHPFFKDKLIATSSTGTVTVRPYPNSSNSAHAFAISKSGAGITVTTSARTAAAFIVSNVKGLTGNQATIATSNGTRLAITGSLSRLAGGTRSTFTF